MLFSNTIFRSAQFFCIFIGNFQTMARYKIYTLLIISTLTLCCCDRITTPTSPNEDLVLWYNAPATIWEEYLPLGNGRIGMMPSGGVASDHIILNEETMWCGGVQHTHRPAFGAHCRWPRASGRVSRGRESKDKFIKVQLYET